ncbi:MAG: bifunctional glutamate N-acetyltransferase/amino-acid acetyltransferase ArgJ [Melioribacteraceae bacterium]|nr:bifunctional glutamate N-acetyltransferase/amino-acid acetyltransferase ArgJ [Melioribacteraceae bacterium]
MFKEIISTQITETTGNILLAKTPAVIIPLGFKGAGVFCGIKKRKKDLALILSDSPATAAGVFTTNIVQAAPLLICKEHLSERETFRALIINSGNANACTGEQGYYDASIMASLTALELGLEKNEVLVSSTGVIGETLPMTKIAEGIKTITSEISSIDQDKEQKMQNAAEAIMTTDTFSKTASSTFLINGKEVTIYGMAKGSGMIHPNMATMLGFILTDAAIEKNLLQSMLKNAANKTFNRIIVDGDTSTNDMVLAFANGASDAKIMLESPEHYIFEDELHALLKKLSLDIVRDGEGATKLIEITVDGAESIEDAEKIGRTIALSPLVKTAIHGEDANWGRIIAAAGYSGIKFDPAQFQIFVNGTKILGSNYSVQLSIEEANKTLELDYIYLTIKIGNGNYSATCWTCDFSEEYVKINGSYRS